MTDDQVSRLLEAVAGLRAQMNDVLRRLDRIEQRMDEGDTKRDQAREETRAAYDQLGQRLDALETGQRAQAAVGAWRFSAWQVAGGLVALLATLVAVAFAVADHT